MMNTYNLAIRLSVEKGMPPAYIMCCFTLPDSVSRAKVPEAFYAAFILAIETGKRTGHTNGLEVVSMAMKAVNERFNGTSFLMMADGFVCFEGPRA